MSAMQEPNRPNISIVAGVGEPTDAPTATTPEPESRPPVPPLPPQELENDVGGPVVNPPTPEDVVRAEGGSLADRMRARYTSMSSTEEFSIPGWELESGEPGLILVAQAFGDRKAYNKGMSNEAFIARSTHKILFVNDDGTREEIPGGWGRGLCELIGVQRPERAADLVALVISKPDPDKPEVRIPNVAAIGVLATQIINWAATANVEAEEQLGE
jgi:hypothetical protein